MANNKFTRIEQEGFGESIALVNNFNSSGYPYASGSSVNGVNEVEFGFITRTITLDNRDASNDLYVNEHGDFSKSYAIIGANKSLTVDWKVSKLYLSASAATEYQVIANLSHVPTRELRAGLTTGSFAEYRGSWIL